MSKKKAEQLGMNPGTASHKLVKDILYNLVVQTGQANCHQCGEFITRDNFSIEHKTPWLDSDDPVKLYFDLQNIAFSHLKCNVGARRQTKVAVCGTRSKYDAGCRCRPCTDAAVAYNRSRYTPERRRAQYDRTGS